MKSKLLLITLIVMLSSSGLMSYQFDIEVAGFTSSSVVKADTGRFSDARYVMGLQEISVLLRNKGTLDAFDFKVNVSLYQEDSTGKFSVGAYYTTLKASVLAGDSTVLKLPVMDDEGQSFRPFTYNEIIEREPYSFTDSKIIPVDKIPVYFRTMLNNVSPRYLVVVKTQTDQDTTNNTIADSMRFYIKQSSFMVSAENSYVEINKLADPDMIAGRLNYDSLCAGMATLGFNNSWITVGEYPELVSFYDVFERTGWEPRSVDYTHYKLMFWSDADENPLSQAEKNSITAYIESGTVEKPNNLFICSQEAIRLNWETDSNWVKSAFFSVIKSGYPTDPNGGKTYNTDDDPEKYLIGNVLLRTLTITIHRVQGFPADPDPLPGLLTPDKDAYGLAITSLNYNPGSVLCPEPVERSAGVTLNSLRFNEVFLAVDWRHLGSVVLFLQGSLDHIARYNGYYEIYQVFLNPNSVKGYPGDSVICKINTYYGDKPVKLVFIINDELNNRVDTLSTGYDGEEDYIVKIPADAKPGTYSIKFKNYINGYINYSENVAINVLSDSATVSGDYKVCLNDTTTYTASGPDRKYSWEAGSGGVIIGSDSGSAVKVKWTSEGTSSLTLHQTIIPTGITKSYKYDIGVLDYPSKPAISSKGDTLFSSSAEGNTWLLDGKEIPGQAGNYIVPSKSGTYTLYVTNANDCRSELSEPFDFIMGVEDENEVTVVSVFPNPFTEGTTIQYTLKNPCTVTLTVFDRLGREIALQGFGRQEAGTYRVQLREVIDAGVYTYRLQCGNSIFSGKLIYLK